jgi:hypothetical protein
MSALATLEDRVNEARDERMQAAQAAINQQVDVEVLTALREEAASRLSELESAIAEINDERLQRGADRFVLPVVEIPTA